MSTNDKITEHVNALFAAHEGAKSIDELKSDLHADLQDRYRELVASGTSEAEALEATFDSIGDIEETVREMSDMTVTLERQMATRFNASELTGSDFAGVTVRKGTFSASAMKGSDFTGADLAGSTFKSSDMAGANFDRANLTDAVLTTSDLTGASFVGAILVRTDFSTSALKDARFGASELTDVRFKRADLTNVEFDGCSFVGVDFAYSNVSGLDFGGARLTSVRFDNAGLAGASFAGATLRDVSFRGWSRKYRTGFRKVDFTGARMDKLTYAGLKSFGADLTGVTVD
ncbi:pentapeptide repeat-containing protein [Leucobacter sp. HNU]|uniref:pentapeptide repeat-containing protein n=1 Tax=Leucobacter sp. HNU TaxID=3236805 RepID=UPI003A80C2D4